MTASLWSTNTDWYLMRASGFVLLILLTISVCLGIANLGRLSAGPWTRTVAALVHRNVALLGAAFLVVHVVTAITDRFVDIPAIAIVVPGLSHFAPLWIGLGAVAFDLLIAVEVSSLIRSRLNQHAWRVVHWCSYLMWPLALFHSIGSGTGSGRDTGTAWSTTIYLVTGGLFAIAVAIRLWLRAHPETTVPSPSRAARVMR